jgi:uncharacterized membrane protein YgdD (TMEM256/DUF423 family)
MNAEFWLRTGAIWGFLAVAMGAFGAHGLQKTFEAASSTAGLPAERLVANFHTASQYHMYCALAILGVGLMVQAGYTGTSLNIAGWSFLAGSLAFSGSLYLLAVTGWRWLGATFTPAGGIIMLIGWIALAVAARSRFKL